MAINKIQENNRITLNLIAAAKLTNFDNVQSVESLIAYINSSLDEVRKSERDAMRAFISEMAQ